MDTPKKAIFIDRDGTILVEPADEQIDSLEKVRFVPGVISALRQLMHRGYELVMVSNQDGLGTDAFPEADFWPAQQLMLDTLAGEGITFDDILIDRSFPADNLPTRKPGTAMLTAYTTGDYDLAACYVIGDRATDVQLAKNLGAAAIYLGDAAHAPQGTELATTDWMQVARHILSKGRKAQVCRRTKETDIDICIDLDGSGKGDIDTGLKFFDHMLDQLPHHGGFDLDIKCKGDLCVDEHHTIEDVAITLGQAVLKALGDKRGIDRYGFVLPMDDARAMVLIDFGGRDDMDWDVTFTREYVGDMPTEMMRHFFRSLASAMQANIHVAAKGDNNHHLAEAIFKGLARAMRMAVRRDPFSYSLPSSKGVL